MAGPFAGVIDRRGRGFAVRGGLGGVAGKWLHGFPLPMVGAFLEPGAIRQLSRPALLLLRAFGAVVIP